MGLEADKETEPYEWWTSFTILMADDDPDQCKVAKEALEENRLAIDLRFVEDGEDRMRSETDVESRPVRVLLVDDDEDDFIITQDLLSEIKGGEFDLNWVATYQAALETMGRHQHDVYLIDYRLGEYNGLELLREVLRNGSQAPMILLTGQGDHTTDLEAMKAGAADYLVKGQIEPSLLERSIRYAIEHNRTLQALRESEAANQVLLAETQRRLNEQIALREAGAIISSALDLETVLSHIAEQMGKAVDATSVYISSYQPETMTSTVMAEYFSPHACAQELPSDLSVTYHLPQDHPGSLNLLQAGQPELVHSDAPDLPPSQRARMHKSGSQTMLNIPLQIRGQTVAFAQLWESRRRREFTPEDIALCQALAQQAAIAIENARLYTMTDQALAKRVQELHTMQLIDQQLNATLDFAHVMELTLEHAMDAVGASSGIIGLLDEEGAGLYLLVQRGVPAEYTHYRHNPWPIGRGAIGRVTHTAQPIVTGNVNECPDFEPTTAQTRSQMVVPVLCQEIVRAVISLESPHPDAFSQNDLDFVTRLSDHAAIAIENARLYQQAQAANQAKTEFMSMVSHELKIPMTSIKGYAKLLAITSGAELAEQQRSFLDIISANVDRMDWLVSDLLDVSHIEAGRLRLEMGPVVIGEVIEEVIQSMKTQIDAKDLNLQVDVPATLPPAWGDRGRLAQIVTNLVSNAYKYTPEGGQIRIVTNGPADSSPTGCLTVFVSDTGLGISHEDQNKLFTKFFRADDPYVRDVPGTGLGLSITKSLIEMHGGEIWFESEPGHGTTFTFTLPVRQTEGEPNQ